MQQRQDLYKGVVDGTGSNNCAGRGLPTDGTTVLGGLNAPKNKVAFLETCGTNSEAMVAAQSLLAASSSHSSLKTVLLKERRAIWSQLLLLELSVSEHSR